MDSKRIVLAFNGDLASCVAVKWLADTHAAEVVTLTVDVGQHDDPEETYSRALACGAHRAHVLDRCEDFARQVIRAEEGSAPAQLRRLKPTTVVPVALFLAEQDANGVTGQMFSALKWNEEQGLGGFETWGHEDDVAAWQASQMIGR